jgi:hypothetical protein
MRFVYTSETRGDFGAMLRPPTIYARNFTRASRTTILPRFSIQYLYDTPRPVVAPLT